MSTSMTLQKRIETGATALRRNKVHKAIDVLQPLMDAPGPADQIGRALRLLVDCHMQVGDLQTAEKAALKTVEVCPGDTEALCRLAAIYNNWQKYERAYEVLRDVDAKQIGDAHIHMFCQAMVKQGDYAKFNELGDIFARLQNVPAGQLVNFLGLNGMRNRLFDRDSLEAYFSLQRKWGAHMDALAAEQPLSEATRRKARANRNTDGRIRVGFFALSNIFSTQAVLRPILRHLDRKTFDARLAFIENGPGVVTDESFTKLFDEVVVIERGGIRDAASKLAELGCDILIDLNGMQQPATYVGALAWRPAPLQLSWTGRPISCALPQLDYNIVDEVLAGDGTGCLSDTLRLPNAFACFGGMPEFALPDDVPSETTGAVTFGINAEPAKFNLRTIDMWAEVLKRTPGRAVFLRPEYNSGHLRANIQAAFAARGVEPERVVFWTDPPAERRGHMRLYNDIDILLDCYPMSGGIGLMEALHMGVPAVTLEGPAIQLRVGASHLHAAGLDDLRTSSVDAYVETAVALAGDLDRRRRLRQELRARLRPSAFVDPEAFAADFNTALKTLAESHFANGWLATGKHESESRTMADDKTVTIDGVVYNWADLSEQARAQLANLRATDQEIKRLRTQLNIAQTARRTYVAEIKAELSERGTGET